MLDLSDNGRHVRTRDGREVLIYNADGGGVRPIHGAIKYNSAEWIPYSWFKSGANLYTSDDVRDLIPYTPTVTWEITCPEGVTPICFCPTGEVRPPKSGEPYAPDDNQVYMRGTDRYSMGKPILASVQPVKVER